MYCVANSAQFVMCTFPPLLLLLLFLLFLVAFADVNKDKYLHNKQEYAMEWFKFDHAWVIVEEERTYYKHVQNIASYTTIFISDPSVDARVVNFGVDIHIRLPALAFKMYYCYTIDGRAPREDQCQNVDKVGTSSFASQIDLRALETGRHSIEANLMILRSELLNSFCVRENEEECEENRKLQKEYPLLEDMVPVNCAIFEFELPPLEIEL